MADTGQAGGELTCGRRLGREGGMLGARNLDRVSGCEKPLRAWRGRGGKGSRGK